VKNRQRHFKIKYRQNHSSLKFN